MASRKDVRQESVADIIGRLRFVASPAPAIYFNAPLVRELFVAQLGAIESFSRSVASGVEGEVGPALVKVGGSKSGSQVIEYDLKDELAQALVLHSALGSEGKVERAGADLPVGTFVEVIGDAYLPHLNLPQPMLQGHDALVQALAAEKDRQQQVAQAFGAADLDLILLLLKQDSSIAASIIDQRYVRPGAAASYLQATQICFGIMERTVAGVAVFTMLYMRPYI